VARWPRRRKSEKLVALIVLEKRQKQPSTFHQTKKKALLSQDLFLCVGAPRETRLFQISCGL